MAHFLYKMNTTDPAPAGDGDTKSWFLFYKWRVEGETYVPLRRPFLHGAAPGDYLWFAFDDMIFGAAKIDRIEIEESQGRQELWFAGDGVLELPSTQAVRAEWLSTLQIPDEVADSWLEKTIQNVGANINNIVQDEPAPGTVLIDATLDVLYPCNYIRLIL